MNYSLESTCLVDDTESNVSTQKRENIPCKTTGMPQDRAHCLCIYSRINSGLPCEIDVTLHQVFAYVIDIPFALM